MNSMMKDISSPLVKIIAGAMMTLGLGACYDKFDPDTYRPEFTISGFTAADQIGRDNLVAYWSFDDNLNEAVSGGAASNKETTFTNGFKGRAVNFNAASESYLTYDPQTSITGLTSFTISMWTNPKFVDNNGDGANDGILGFVNLSNPTGFWGNIDWFVENNSNADAAKIVFHVTTANGETWVNVNGVKNLFDKWSSHTVTYDEATSTFSYYIDGSRLVTETAAWTGPIEFAGSGPMVFGTVQFQTDPSIGCCGKQDWASYLTGIIDEVRIYDRALTGEEINALVVLQGKGK